MEDLHVQNKEDLRDQQIKKNPSRRNADEMLKKRPRIFYTLLKKGLVHIQKVKSPSGILSLSTSSPGKLFSISKNIIIELPNIYSK